MKLSSNSFVDGAAIPGEFAFCVPDDAHHVSLGSNRNPHLAWSEVPEGCRSFALICCDPDVPSQGDDVNQEGRTVPAALPRVDFFHWVVADLPATLREIPAGSFSGEVVPRGKPGPSAPHGSRQGINDYTSWFAGDQDMRGDYYGYDGPCPPWNDEIRHRYVFTLYALDLEQLPLQGPLTGPALRQAIQGHVLAEASLTGTYSLNPALL
ncbi:YbhB/YbcL family Raf kinase inhibitor-like protein [Azovibrio restrictus]|uniref:YbhB/YbcL family Raf kinase inhibitor-like protein n=1 Tax=Azovibrio restrictus TaxID=146938 RepID=UPI0026EC9FD2|nr:YbhB/YbcL family Raf kinase inhibitor-like protein [Azovibrio restrictus]MDD3481880.1 YbhB/YbcL family Raf kinase inhibitor-like protein [Azovibrio restrictus]